MQFKDVIGQSQVKKRLLETVKNGRISHAQLFLGKGVTGKFALALAFAQYINCNNRTDTDSCGTCPSCRKYQNLSHPDLFFSFPVNKEKSSTSAKDLVSTMFNKEWSEYLKKCQHYPELQEWYKEINLDRKQGIINVEEARRIVRDLHFKPVEAQQKVIIIWQPEKMNVQSANLLLKFFEEPPAHTLILMIADEKDQLLKTIQSRFQIIPIPKISPKYLYAHLQRKFPNHSSESLQSLVNLADGDLKKVENLIHSSDQIKEHFTMFSSWMRICYGRGKLGEMKTFVEKISKIGREKQKAFLNYSLRLTRECFISNYGHPSLNKITQYEQDFILKFAPFIHINNGVEITKKFEESIFQIGRNANATVLFMSLSLDMSKLLKIAP